MSAKLCRLLMTSLKLIATKSKLIGKLMKLNLDFSIILKEE